MCIMMFPPISTEQEDGDLLWGEEGEVLHHQRPLCKEQHGGEDEEGRGKRWQHSECKGQVEEKKTCIIRHRLAATSRSLYLLPANRWSLYPLPASCWSLYPLPAGPYTRYLLFPLRATCYCSRHILNTVHSPVSIAKWKNSHIHFGVLLKNSILNNLNVIISKRMLLVVVGLVFFVVSLCFKETKQYIFLLLNLYTIPICSIFCNTVKDFPPCRTFLRVP